MKKISIITACYNSEKYIEQTIKSVIGQTYKSIEYILVDGGSKDTTFAIIEKYKAKIQMVISEPDKGVYDAFNKGIKVATGEIIYFLNSDDYLVDRSVIEDIMKFFDDNQQFEVVYGNILMKNEETGFTTIFGRKFDVNDFRNGKMPPHPGLFIKRELLTKYNGFSIKYKIASDFDLLTKVFIDQYEKTAYLDKRIACFRLGGLSSSIKNKKKTEEETNEIVNNHFGIVKPPRTPLEQNIQFYKGWLEKLLISKKSISDSLKEQDVKNVAIFGTNEIALFVLEDLRNSQIETLAFLDNNKSRQGIIMRGVTIFLPDWLKRNSEKIDAIIMAFEGDYEDEIRSQIGGFVSHPMIVLSWKELLEEMN